MVFGGVLSVFDVPGQKSKKVSRKTFSAENSEPIATNRIKIGLELWAIVLPNHKKIAKHGFWGVFDGF